MANTSQISGVFTILTDHSPDDLTAFFFNNQHAYYGAFDTPDLDLSGTDQIKSKTATDFNMVGRWTFKNTLHFILDVAEDDDLPKEVRQRLDGMTVEINYEEYETGQAFACEGFVVVRAVYDEETNRLETETVKFEEHDLPFTAETLVNYFGLDGAWDTFSDYGRKALTDHMIADEQVPEPIRRFLESIKDDDTDRKHFFNSVFDEDIKAVYDMYFYDQLRQ